MAVGQGQRSVAFKDLDNAKFSAAHVRAMLVAGSGFFVDSYDNFVIGLIVPMIAWEYYHKSSLPSTRGDGWVKAASSWGNMCGQVSFAVLGDILGRKKVYGIELMILIVGALLTAFATWPVNGNPDNLLWLLAIWRFVLGIGIGGDYPVSAVITSEFASSDHRGQFIAAVFAMQGFGIITGAVLAVIMLHAMENKIVENPKNIGYVWRTLAGFGAIPALAAVYWRLRIPETPRFTVNVLHDQEAAVRNANQFLQGTTHDHNTSVPKPNTSKSFTEAFRTHFSQWANLKVLIGCAACWFFLDIDYYGTSLNTPVILDIIGYGTPKTTGNQKIFDDLWNRAVGTAIINMCGTVPGYWFTVFLIEPWGRKPIQYMGFTLLTILFLVMAIWLDQFKTDYRNLFVVLYSLAQFFFNFGPNATTFIIPAEVFPMAVRSTGHGISAASGKAGAIIAAQCFAVIARHKFGFKGVLYIFSGCCLTLEELSGDSDKDGIVDDNDEPAVYAESKTPTSQV
ncbi:unnamed protein product [Aphanomyces euteiches]